MHTVTHSLIEAHANEPVKITFTVTDQNGSPVTVSGASATYKIARRAGDSALLTKTQSGGITLSSNTAVVEFNAAELSGLLGNFFTQLTITLAGDPLVVAEGPLEIHPIIG